MYAIIYNGVVADIELRGLPLENFVNPEFHYMYIPITENLQVLKGDLYDEETKTFTHVEQEPEPEVSNDVKRKLAYNTLSEKPDGTPIVLWRETSYTVEKAMEMYNKYYFIEPDADALKSQILEAREYIRSLHP